MHLRLTRGEKLGVVVGVGVGYGDDAAVGDFADFVLELNRRVVDVEVVGEALVEGTQDRFALRGF